MAAMIATVLTMIDEAAAEGPPHPLLSIVWVFATLLSGRPHAALTRLNSYLRGDDPWLRGGALLVRGMLRFGSGRLRPAAADMERAAARFREIGERGGLGQALIALADVANIDGDPARALALIEEASVLLRPSLGGEDSHMLFARMAGIRAQSGDLRGARDELDRARSALPTEPTASVASHVLLAEADLARRSGDPKTAIAVYESLRAELAQTPTDPGRQQRAMVSIHLARVLFEGGDRSRARDLLREALVVLGDSTDLGLFVHVVEGFIAIEEDPARVVTMVAAAQALRGGWAPALPSAQTAEVVDRARTRLDEAGYAVAHAAGRAMDRAALTAYLS
jgi:tetratricopeptide (TPR) repeat protein